MSKELLFFIYFLTIVVFCIIRGRFMCMKNFNEVIATHLSLKSILIPIGDGMTVSKVKK
ncbi:methyltransferase [Bacillus thuringiensis serovar sylvestriensis]|nr:methyltransferase [Bacillus thuringiensis serovar sylvestriensis]